MALTMWVVFTLSFFLMRAVQGDPFQGEKVMSPEVKQAMREKYGYNKPLIEQYLLSMRNIVTLDFGTSFVSDQPVLPTLMAAIGRSAILAGLALILTVPISILAGMYAARRRDRTADRAIGSDRKRSIKPLLMSSQIPTAVVAHANTTVWAKMPGIRNSL